MPARPRPTPAGTKRAAPRLDVDVVAGGVTAARGLAAWLSAAAPARAKGSVCVALLSDARVRALNRQFRRVDKATDVLSFPCAPLDGSIGDVVIATGVARRQAREAGHSLAVELKVLALHGLLHLMGYDHETDDGQMARVERRLRARHGLPSGLIERAHA